MYVQQIIHQTYDSIKHNIESKRSRKKSHNREFNNCRKFEYTCTPIREFAEKLKPYSKNTIEKKKTENFL